MNPALIGALLLSAGLVGCATPSAYDWGGYDQLLYLSYKDPATSDAMLVGIETHIGALEAAGSRVAPGLYAELGTLYLERGELDRAIEWYAKERDAWPESKYLMEAMIASLERRGMERTEAVQ
jgi:hypothetical protein